MLAKTPLRQNRNGRIFYMAAAVSALITAIVGFSHTYYFKLYFGYRELPALLHFHGVVMTAWLLVFILQVRFVAIRRIDLHRRLGKIGLALAALVLISATAAAFAEVKRDIAFVHAIPFLAIQLGDLVVFATLIALGWAYRRQRDFHGRFLLLANFSVLPSAIIRVLIIHFHTSNQWIVFALNNLFVMAFLAYDITKHRRVHPALIWGSLFFVVTEPLRLLIGNTDAWHRAIMWLIT